MIPEEFKSQMTKLLRYLGKMGIIVEFGELNAYFRKESKELAISLKYLYRYSGICSILKPIGESGVEVVKVSNDMFYDNYVKATIDLYFK
jgi:ribosomal protein S8